MAILVRRITSVVKQLSSEAELKTITSDRVAIIPGLCLEVFQL